MLLTANDIMHRDIDQCFFDTEAFKAFFMNDTGYTLIKSIVAMGEIDEEELLSMSSSIAQRNQLEVFIKNCIEQGILSKKI